MRANCPTHDKGRFGSNPAVAVLHGRRFTCSQLPSVRRKCVCIARDVFSVAGNSVWFAGRVFASIAAAIGPSQPFWHRSQRICVAGNRLRSAGRIFAPFPAFFCRGQHVLVPGRIFCVDCSCDAVCRNIFALFPTRLRCGQLRFGPRAEFLRRSQRVYGRWQLRSVRGERFCVDRSCDQSVATVFVSRAVAIGASQPYSARPQLIPTFLGQNSRAILGVIS